MGDQGSEIAQRPRDDNQRTDQGSARRRKRLRRPIDQNPTTAQLLRRRAGHRARCRGPANAPTAWMHSEGRAQELTSCGQHVTTQAREILHAESEIYCPNPSNIYAGHCEDQRRPRPPSEVATVVGTSGTKSSNGGRQVKDERHGIENWKGMSSRAEGMRSLTEDMRSSADGMRSSAERTASAMREAISRPQIAPDIEKERCRGYLILILIIKIENGWPLLLSNRLP
jgi:hypothetical protein